MRLCGYVCTIFARVKVCRQQTSLVRTHLRIPFIQPLQLLVAFHAIYFIRQHLKYPSNKPQILEAAFGYGNGFLHGLRTNVVGRLKKDQRKTATMASHQQGPGNGPPSAGMGMPHQSGQGPPPPGQNLSQQNLNQIVSTIFFVCRPCILHSR